MNKRVAESYEGLASGAAKLHIEYSAPVNGSNLMVPASGSQVIQITTMEVFPNPVVSDQVYISVNRLSDHPATLELIDIFGRKTDSRLIEAHENGTFTFNLSDLPSGTYFIRLSDGFGFSETRKILVQRP